MKIPPQPIKALQGDSRWTYISPFASYAPIIVLSLLIVSIIQIILGAVWISKLEGDLSFALVLQPLVLPCLSFFNTVPSAHLHLFTRTNNPLLALWFSGILASLYLVSALIDIAVCSGTSTLQSECPRTGTSGTGPSVSQDFWNANVGLWLVSFLGYALLTVMAAIVWVGFRKRERDGAEVRPGGAGEEGGGDAPERVIRTRGIGEGRRVRDWEEEMLTEEQRAERLRIAEAKWRKVIM